MAQSTANLETTTKNIMTVHQIPGDGNCLFNAVLHQVQQYNPLLPIITVQQLRVKIVEFIQEERNLSNYIPTILDSCRSVYNPDIISTTSETQLIAKYLEDLKQDGFWGGAECLSAISSMWHCKIIINQTRGQDPINFHPTSGGYFHELHLIYSGDHYDSVLMQPDLTSTNQSNPGSHQSIRPHLPRNIQPTRNPYTLIEESQPISSPFNPTDPTVFCAGTWNTRGVNDPRKRDIIDGILDRSSIAVCSIQETNLSTSSCVTSHYTWYFANDPKTKRTGVAILVRRNSFLQVEHIRSYFGAIITLLVNIPFHGSVLFISVYVPSQNSACNRILSSKIFTKLQSIVDRCPKKRVLILLGDFNAHLGSLDVHRGQSIGPNLYHRISNANGISLSLLASLGRLFIQTTKGRRKTITTWTDGRVYSQIDHILTRQKNNIIYVNAVKVSSFQSTISDHRLVWISCTLRNRSRFGQRSLVRKTTTNTASAYSYKSLDLTMLQDEQICKQYKETLSSVYSRAILDANTGALWKIFVTSIKIAAQQTLIRRASLTTPTRRALARFKSAQHQKNLHPQDAVAQVQLRNARAQYNQAISVDKEQECEQFFRGLSNFKPSERLRRTYSYLKQYRRSNQATRGQYIPLSAWDQELRRTEGEWLTLIEEDANCQIGSPPTEADVRATIQQIRSRTAPGTDGISIELLKHLPDDLIQALHEILKNVWTRNESPMEWLETIQVPIPKTRNPKDTNEYRRITLCNIGYKVYAKLLLDKLDEHLGSPSTYQAAFLANRSTDDHLYTIRRVLDEEWRAGHRLSVLSLDLAKAFDTVRLDVMAECLQQQVAAYLVNRIIRTCFWERTCLKWYHLTTDMVKKNKGVKQGCPLSPRLFNFILNEVLLTVADQFPELQLEQCDNLKLPLILAYADDIILVTRDPTTLEPMIQELITVLEFAGLELNFQKCSMLIRDPKIQHDPPSIITIAGIPFKTVKQMRYLGTELTSNLSRPMTIRTRCHNALGLTRMMQSYIKRFHIPFQAALIMYNTTIVPMITYGLKTAALTSANRRRLRQYELYLLRKLFEFALNKPATRKVKELLHGKTITKKIKIQRINYWGHIHRREPNHILRAASTYLAGPKKLGRPCFTWNDSLRHNLQYYNRRSRDWLDILPQRSELRKAAEELYQYSESDSSDMIEDEPEETASG